MHRGKRPNLIQVGGAKSFKELKRCWGVAKYEKDRSKKGHDHKSLHRKWPWIGWTAKKDPCNWPLAVINA